MSCHFPAALLFTPLLVAFLGFTAWQEKSWRILWMQAGSFLLALGISAFIWAPALWARQYASMNRAVEGNGKYSNHLVYLHQLFYSPWGYGLSVPGPDDGMSFAVGWSHLLLAAAVWIWMSRTKPIDLSLVRFFAIAALVLCVLMLQDAIWIWEQVPLLQNVQLPWRLLGPVTLCVAMLIAPLGRLLASVPRWQTVGTAAAMSLLIVPNLSHLHPRQFVDVDLRFWTPQQLSIRGFETTTMAEIQPRWIRGLPPYLPVAATVLSGDAEIESPGRTEFSWSSLVKVRRTSVIEMNTAWFPGWQVRIDGGDAPAGPGPQSGLITFAVSPGEHTVQVQYARTPTEKSAGGISIAALVVTILVALYVALYSGRSQRNIAG
jgi:hypothetical protein